MRGAVLNRISIVGSPGAGKSTLARALSEGRGRDWIELDRLYHMPGWTPRDREELRADVAQRLQAPRWVVDGNYRSSVQDLVWAEAETVVWLDLPRRVVLPALLGRSLWRGALRQELWNGNRERLLNLAHPDPEENIFLWGVTRFARYRERYLEAMMDPRWAHLQFIRLRSRAEVASFLGAAG